MNTAKKVKCSGFIIPGWLCMSHSAIVSGLHQPMRFNLSCYKRFIQKIPIDIAN